MKLRFLGTSSATVTLSRLGDIKKITEPNLQSFKFMPYSVFGGNSVYI